MTNNPNLINLAGLPTESFTGIDQIISKQKNVSSHQPRKVGLQDVNLNFDMKRLPPQQWVAEGYFLKKAVTVLAGAGSVGKSLYTLDCALALSLGIPLGNMKPTKRQNVLMYAIEDDSAELQSRISAFLTANGKTLADLNNHLSIVTISDDTDGIDGRLFNISKERKATPDSAYDEILVKLETRKGTPEQIDILFIDPYAEIHNGDENDNTVQASIIGKFKQLSREFNCSVVIVHHFRKEMEDTKSAASIRGASAIVNAARIVFVANTMSAEEAGDYNFTPDERENYFSIKRVKCNYAKNGALEWFRKDVADLPQYNGAVFQKPYVVPKEPEAVSVSDDTNFSKLLKCIAQGVDGLPYSPTKNAQRTNLKPLLDKLGFGNRRSQVEAELLKHGFKQNKFKNVGGKPQNGWRSPDGLPDTVEWLP